MAFLRDSFGQIQIESPVVGSQVPDFELADLRGGRMTLSQWRGRWLVLLFIDPAGPGSYAIGPTLAALPASPPLDRPLPILVSTSGPADNRRFLAEFGISARLVLQDGSEYADLCLVKWTPMAMLVSPDGRLARLSALGPEEVVALASNPVCTPRAIPGGLSRYRAPHSRPDSDGLPVGAAAPSFRLPSLDGGHLTLGAFRGRRVLLVFADPECPICRDLCPVLERARAASSDLQVLVISRGDEAANRAWLATQAPTLPVALQRRWEVSREYGVLATPVAYLVDASGVVATRAVVGATPIEELAAWTARTDDARSGGR